MGGVKRTRYLLKIRNHAPRKAENSVPPLFFEKAGDKKNVSWLNKKKKKKILLASSVFFQNWPENLIILFLGGWGEGGGVGGALYQGYLSNQTKTS